MTTDRCGLVFSSTEQAWFRERKKRLWRIIKPLLENLTRGKILDVGMGKQSLIKMLFPHLYVVGVDKTLPVDYPDEFHLLDFKDCLPFKAGDFRMVFAGEIIEHLQVHLVYSLFKESFRVLNPEGFLLLTTPNGYRNILKKLLKRDIPEAHAKEYGFYEIIKIADRVGFQVHYAEGIQPFFIPWRLNEKIVSLRVPCALSSQLIILFEKKD